MEPPTFGTLYPHEFRNAFVRVHETLEASFPGAGDVLCGYCDVLPERAERWRRDYYASLRDHNGSVRFPRASHHEERCRDRSSLLSDDDRFELDLLTIIHLRKRSS
jgi:hypothetical protein